MQVSKNNDKTNFTVNTYPAGAATDYRLRNECDKSIKPWSGGINITRQSHPISSLSTSLFSKE